jgi:NADPH-dependent 2,4-dienoyl-CoA reductase/sulfur reductase-like enzyme
VIRYDVAVVGGGPAGLAAAAAASGDARAVVVDAGSRLGGQFWRHRAGAEPPALWRLRSSADHLPDAPVWFAEPVDPVDPAESAESAESSTGFRLHTPAGVVTADRIVLATGAHDRSVPFPGWTLPGVVTVGAAQALLKAHGVLIGRRVAVAGAGPFLLAVAAGLATAGAEVVGVFEAGYLRGYAKHPRALGPAKLAEGARYAAVLARQRVPYRRGHTVTAAHGTDALEAITVTGRGRERRLDVDALAISYGFTPQVELAIALGCDTHLDRDGSLVVTVDDDQRTSIKGVYAAGEITGVGGADLAQLEGRIAGRAAAGKVPDPAPRRQRAKARRFARAMHDVHRRPSWIEHLADDTLICRCEEVPYAEVREAVELGATDTRAVKLLCRAGMGWCQGRICGPAVAELTAHLNGRPPTRDDQAAFANRAIAQPTTLGDLAGP